MKGFFPFPLPFPGHQKMSLILYFIYLSAFAPYVWAIKRIAGAIRAKYFQHDSSLHFVPLA
ncbi:hypothetical protein A3841_18015 [Pontibacter flavimaris]|uniref:Uncharacterized protein n=1 Tax=Pontibacter flavimaris TaxID=1797110 RepID=A0A1Q5PDG4_9BACT|nr:hypothetical protein A3841_18015 [Pontibacter flavimaris]